MANRGLTPHRNKDRRTRASVCAACRGPSARKGGAGSVQARAAGRRPSERDQDEQHRVAQVRRVRWRDGRAVF